MPNQVNSVDRALLREHFTLLRSPPPTIKTFGMSKGSFSLWCFTPSVAWRALTSASASTSTSTGLRSAVLASGTLHPLDKFARDFAAPFPVQYAGEHVIDSQK